MKPSSAYRKILYHKPLASRSGTGLFPTVFVDTSVERCGPMMPDERRVADFQYDSSGYAYSVAFTKQQSKDPTVFNPDQSATAAAQWGSALEQQSESDPWLKSWYFPTDAFDPWPSKQTDLCCWWCTYPFEGSPFPMPRKFNKITGQYVVMGVFCGPSCAKAYASDGEKYINRSEIRYWIDKIAYEFYGYKSPTGGFPIIPIAPKREILQKFCGPKGFSIEQYRMACAHGRTITLLDPGFITLKQIVEAEDIIARRRMFECRKKMLEAAAKSGSDMAEAMAAADAIVTRQKQLYHPENPDDIKSIDQLVAAKRSVFVGKGTKPLSSFFKRKS